MKSVLITPEGIQKNLKNDFDIDIIDMEMFGNNGAAKAQVFQLQHK